MIGQHLSAISIARNRRHRRIAGWSGAATGLATLLIVGPYVPFATPLLGLIFTIGLPAVLLLAKLRFPGSPLAHRVVFATALAVFLLVLVGLAVNTALPLLGDTRPLERTPVGVAVLLEVLSLVIWRASQTPGWPNQLPRLPTRSRWVWALLGLSLLGCIAGTNRLNNGASGAVTEASFVVVLCALGLAWRWRREIGDGETAGFFYLVALVLLLATSLRGWYITGHDIQREYHVFQLTSVADRWNISAFQDPYNACLSLTILPTVWARLLRIDEPYVFKVVYQALFALSASALYLVCRRQFSRETAFLAVIFYVSFPTFSTDMPFITRQEVGFTFLSVAVLAIMSNTWAPAGRRAWFVVFASAIVLSHYSTTYLLLIALGFSQVIWRFRQSLAWMLRRARPRSTLTPAWGRPVAGLSTLLVVSALAFLWTEPATHTSSQLRLTITDTIQSLLGRQQATDSSDISYSLVHSAVLSPQQELAQYKKVSLQVTAADLASYLPRSKVDAYATPTIAQPNLKPTALGRMLERIGISPVSLNSLMRSLLAKYYQVAAIAGLLILAWSYRRGRRAGAPEREFLSLAAASFCGLAAVVVLPDLSAEYGLLRAFQQALIFLAPLVAETTLLLAYVVARRFAGGLAIGSGVVVLASLSGVIPQATGGYPPQLNLNNSGTYYNDYYLHAQELDAISWLDGQVRSKAAVQAEVETDRYTSYLVGESTARTTADVFPTLIEQNAFVFLGYATVTRDESSVSIDGNTVSYRYPLGLLNTTKDLVFSSDGSRIYR